MRNLFSVSFPDPVPGSTPEDEVTEPVAMESEENPPVPEAEEAEPAVAEEEKEGDLESVDAPETLEQSDEPAESSENAPAAGVYAVTSW